MNRKTFVEPLSDEEAVTLLVKNEKYDDEAAREVVAKWRKIASDHGYTGPIAWSMKSGFTLKNHAPKAGPCYKNFNHLQNWSFEDEPTPDSLVFFVPRTLDGSRRKDTYEQLQHLAEVRQQREFPKHHLQSFGSVAMVSALILAHFKRTGERAPLKRYYVRTDTRSTGRRRLDLGDFDWSGLGCSDGWDGNRYDGLGVFPLGVETLGS